MITQNGEPWMGPGLSSESDGTTRTNNHNFYDSKETCSETLHLDILYPPVSTDKEVDKDFTIVISHFTLENFFYITSVENKRSGRKVHLTTLHFTHVTISIIPVPKTGKTFPPTSSTCFTLSIGSNSWDIPCDVWTDADSPQSVPWCICILHFNINNGSWTIRYDFLFLVSLFDILFCFSELSVLHINYTKITCTFHSWDFIFFLDFTWPLEIVSSAHLLSRLIRDI